GRQRGLVYHKKPAGNYEYLYTIEPNPITGIAGFRVDNLIVGTHNFQVVTVSSLGVQQTAAVVEYPIAIQPYLIAPPRPTSGSGDRRNSVVRWKWGTVPNRNVRVYRITDTLGAVLAEVDTDYWDEAVPALSSITRRVYTIDTTGNVSADYREVTYNADYGDQRVVFFTPVGSGNFIPSGEASLSLPEPAVYLNGVNGSFDPDTKIWVKTAPDNWDAGFILNRAIAYGDCRIDFTIPYSSSTAGDHLIFGFSTLGTEVVDSLSDPVWGLNPVSSFFSGGASKFAVLEFGGIPSQPAVTWAQGDVVSVRIEGGVVKYYKNSTLLYTSLVAPTYPLTPFVLVYKNPQSVYLVDFVVTGILQDTTPTKPHWKNQVGARLDSNDNLIRTAAGSGWGASGAFSVESILGSGYIEFNHCGGGTNKNYIVGFSDSNPDQSYPSMDYSVTVGTADAFGAGNQGLQIYENNVQVHSFISGSLTTNSKIRISIENGTVKYRLDGVVIYTSLTPIDLTVRWHVDAAINMPGSPVLNVRMGSIGSRGVGWRISPDGLGEFAEGVKVGGSSITAIQARALNALGEDSRYRGNDLGVPLENRLTASMFRLGTLRTLETDIYIELLLDIPESILNDGYANFDSAKLARVKVYNVLGDIITQCEQSFSGRGKFVVGIHSRDYADPIEQAVFSVEIRNAYGWSKPFF
ncbi:MAG: hypothetical protein ACRD5H_07640, partial [Nitrososphaerales archaeon]